MQRSWSWSDYHEHNWTKLDRQLLIYVLKGKYLKKDVEWSAVWYYISICLETYKKGTKVQKVKWAITILTLNINETANGVGSTKTMPKIVENAPRPEGTNAFKRSCLSWSLLLYLE